MGDVAIMPDDPIGTVNVSKVILEMPDSVTDSKDGVSKDMRETHLSIQRYTIDYLNRLVEVIRYTTHRYWIRRLSGFYINIYNIEIIGDDGRGRSITMFGAPRGYTVPIVIRPEEEVKTDLDKMLLDEDPIPISENLMLDALQFCSYGHFSESIIVANISIEVFVERKIFIDLVSQKVSEESALEISNRVSESFEKGMKYFFFERYRKNKSQYDEKLLQSDLVWKTVENIRNVRRSLIHPQIGKLSYEETLKTLNEIFYLINWLNSFTYYHIKN
jgi:hypothetical protein